MSHPRLHHTGFVVASIEECAEQMANSLSLAWDGVIILDPLQFVRVTFLPEAKSGAASIELVEPAGPRSPVKKFAEAGGGLHHVCYEVDDLKAQLSQSQSTPRQGFRGTENRLGNNTTEALGRISGELVVFEFRMPSCPFERLAAGPESKSQLIGNLARLQSLLSLPIVFEKTGIRACRSRGSDQAAPVEIEAVQKRKMRFRHRGIVKPCAGHNPANARL